MLSWQLSTNPYCPFTSILIIETIDATLLTIINIHRQVIINIIFYVISMYKGFIFFQNLSDLAYITLLSINIQLIFSKFLINIFNFFHQEIDLNYSYVYICLTIYNGQTSGKKSKSSNLSSICFTIFHKHHILLSIYLRKFANVFL